MTQVPTTLVLAGGALGLAWLFVRSMGLYHEHVKRGRESLQGGAPRAGTANPMSWEEFRWHQADEGLPYSV